MAKTPTERSRDFRKRKAEMGHTEVRGIMAPPELHEAIKRAAKKIIGKG